MITRKMNTRITFYSKEGGQNEDGEVIAPSRKDIMTCWAEVSKTSIKDFRESNDKTNSVDGLINTNDSKVFLIRYIPNFKVDNSMYVEFNTLEYRITAIEIDYANKDMIMVSGVRIE